jgi:peptidoglycan/xylan/chitin deacetylase (PgdA/CDA1 family)
LHLEEPKGLANKLPLPILSSVNPPAFITTSWDDGHPLDLHLAELLRKYGLPGTFYVPLDHELPVVTPSQIRELSADFEVGGHTLHHCDLLTIPASLARREITDCKSELEQICGRACTSFCFPKGHFSREHVRMVRAAGYRTARTVELMSLEMPQMQDGVALLATTIQAVPAGLSQVARNSLKRLRPTIFFRHLFFGKSDWVGTAEAVLEYVLNRGGVFHLWGHSWEIDRMGQWDNLERVFAMLAQCEGRARFTDNTGLSIAATP